MFSRTLEHAGHVRRFVIQQTGFLGWEVRREEDSEIVRAVTYTDWHRVERARTMIDLEMSGLTARGWVEVQGRSD